MRGFKEVAEFEAEVFTHQGMEEMRLRVEVNTRARPHCESIQTKLQEELLNRLGLRIEVEMVAPRSQFQPTRSLPPPNEW
ncbi:MAG: hypothetical protein ACE5MK_12870 [Acidobacteriota bacterium]